MDNNKEVQYDFCPKCGALARDGVCTSCGFGSVPAEPVVEVATPVVEIVEPVVEVATPVVETVEPVVEVATPVTEQVPVNTVRYTAPVPPVNNNPYVNNPYANAGNTNNAGNANAYGNAYANPYGEYQNYTAYNNGAIPADVPAKKKNGKVWAIVGVCVGIVVLLMVLLGVAIGQLVSKIDEAASTYGDDIWDDYYDDDYDYDFDYDGYDDEEYYDYDEFYNGILEERDKGGYDSDEFDGEEPMVSPDGKTYGYAPDDDYYYQLNDNIRDDLSYSVYFEEEEYSDDVYAYVECVYPVLEGDIPNIDYLNDIIYAEYTYFVDYYTENVKSDSLEDGYFYALSTGYVTYMDEEVISIVFREEASSAEYSLLALYCINVDVEKGIVIDNTEIIDANDKFSVDFRIREAEQNQSDVLDYYTDQELTEMLNDSYNLIIFYTPLGLEVGLNHDFGWSTTTYKDYENYLKHF